MTPLARVVDGHIARQHTGDVLVQVAVGVLIRSDGRFLLTSRPPGKAYAGYWEFPGGKLEAGESVAQALQRELHEELGIHAEAITLWKTEQVDYPHALVQLNFCKVTGWQGELQMREGQQYSWETLPVQVRPVLAGTLPVLEWLAESEGPLGGQRPHGVGKRGGYEQSVSSNAVS